MKKISVALLLVMLFAETKSQDIIHINKKNYNPTTGLVEHNGKPYTGKAQEKLKGEGHLIGNVKNGDITGIWEYYEHHKLVGFNGYKSNGDTTYSFDMDGNLLWLDIYEDNNNKVSNIKLDGNFKEIDFLKITTSKSVGILDHMFEFQKFKNHHFEYTIADYDYASRTVLDYFESTSDEQEIVIRNFNNNKELVKIMCSEHKVNAIFLNKDYLEMPEDADYKLDEKFSVSFTELKNHENFKLTLLNDKKPVFEVFIVEGIVQSFDKFNAKDNVFVIYDHNSGYLPGGRESFQKLIQSLTMEAKAYVKNYKK